MSKYNFYIIITLLFFITSLVYADNKSNLIYTSSGKVSGYLANKVLNYEDIPYALPPINNLRWKAPREIYSPNQIIRSKDNNHCVQESFSMGGVASIESITGTEDCLYLDIRTPKDVTSGPYPVMVWIHGGGNTSGLKDLYDFSTFVFKHNIIVVTINYRLGPFGWFYHPAIQGSQLDLDKSSNFGTLDIIEALKWVNKNIESFGGDPDNITIFGESAGGHNVLSLLVSPKANNLFDKAISQSGYTTSIPQNEAYIVNRSNPSFSNTSSEVIKELIENYKVLSEKDLKQELIDMDSKYFFSKYLTKSNYELPLLNNDDIVIPRIGLKTALSNEKYLKNIPVMAGYNRDEVKLWLATSKYFVDIKFSPIGFFFGIPKLRLKNEEAFEAFNYYRSESWKVRGVIEPLSSLNSVGNLNTYAYRFDWDDHRRFFVGDFQKLIGAAHATEIPLLTGNNKLVEGYGFLIYPNGPSKRFVSKNMMTLWANFAKLGYPGKTTNGIEWRNYSYFDNKKNFLILDKKKQMKLEVIDTDYLSLIQELNIDDRLNNIEKCVILFQMSTYVGNDIFDKLRPYSNFKCNKNNAIDFIKANSEIIEY